MTTNAAEPTPSLEELEERLDAVEATSERGTELALRALETLNEIRAELVYGPLADEGR